MAHQAQPLVPDTGNGPRDHVFFVRLYCCIRHTFTLRPPTGWNLIRLHRIITGRLILDGLQEGFDTRARLLGETKTADEATQ